MPRAEGNKAYTQFVGGLITEAGPLTFPENASKDEDNCVLLRKGNRKRRLGLDYESSFSLSSLSYTDLNLTTDYITTFVWSSVGGDGNKNFLAVQIGAMLHFYDLAVTPLSGAKKSFTVSLSAYAAAGASNIDRSKVTMDSGKGYLFVVGARIDPIYIKYDSDLDTITTVQPDIKIRDFEGVEDNLGVTEEPATLSDEHSYNLKNQGWESPGTGVADPVTTYFSSKAVYPPNSKQWWVAKDSSENFSADILTKYNQGNMESPKGHFILNAFNKDRATASGIVGLSSVIETSRPAAVAFFAGRVFYAGLSSSENNGSVFYSQIIESDSNIGRCYQSGDPTSEDVPDLIDTDGGVLQIPEIGTVHNLFVMEEGLLVFANNGTWIISGPDQQFTATSFNVNKISSVGIFGPESLVDVEGVPFWWAEQGIYTLSVNQVSLKLFAQSLTDTTIASYYLDIPSLSRVYCKGVYDPSEKVLKWFYANTQDNSDFKHRYDRVLNFDTTINAFYPWSISPLDSDSPYIASVFTIPSLTSLTEDFTVVDSVGDTVVDSSGNTVIITADTLQGGITQTGILTFAQTAVDTNKYTFAQFNNSAFLDWESADSTGIDYSSFLETGYELGSDIARFKQAPYIISYFNRTEESWVSDGTGGYELSPQSGCLGRAMWDWADVGRGKWSSQFVAYRIIPTPVSPGAIGDFENGKPVVITRNKIRGKGRALSLRYESETGKDFDLLGWFLPFTGNTKI